MALQGRTHRTWPVGVLLLLAGCSGTVVVDAGEVPPPECSGTLCVEPTGEARLADTSQALEDCVPDPASTNGSPDGLRVGGVAVLATTDDDVTLRLVLANIAPQFVSSYPGLRLEVVRTDAPVATFEAGQFYGIEGCGRMETDVTVAWSLVTGARLTLSATNDLGATVLDSISFTLRQGRDR